MFFSTALKRRELAELFESSIDLRACERAETLHAKAFAAEAPQHGAVNDGAAQHAAVDVIPFQAEPVLGQIADEAAGKAVAGAGRIEDVLQQIPGHDEVGIVPEQ